MYRPVLLATLALLCLPLAAEPRLATLEYPPYSSQAQAAGGRPKACRMLREKCARLL